MPSVIEDSLVFVLDDPERAFLEVHLDCDDAVAGSTAIPAHRHRLDAVTARGRISTGWSTGWS